METIDIRDIVERALEGHRPRRALLIHPDYSRNDFTHQAAPALFEALAARGLERLDTLNAAGTHRRMTDDELRRKLGGIPARMHNHAFDDPRHLFDAGEVPASFVSEVTGGEMSQPLRVTANRHLLAGHDLIVCLSGTSPHEALGYSGGAKALFPGVSGPEVIALLHWAAVLIGIPRIIGALDNPARRVVDAGAALILEHLRCPVLSLIMVSTEDAQHQAVPRGLFAGWGMEGMRAAHRQAAELSSRLHVRYVEAPCEAVVQCIPAMYDEVWTAGKGSYKLQKPGVLAPGAEVILLAPHIRAFHSHPEMDAAIRAIGYHGRARTMEYLRRNPGFDRNVAAHVINVRGSGEEFAVTLASAIPRDECEAAGLRYRHPADVTQEAFPGAVWIDDGGKWLYARAE
jgi:nickel-dependent lactate racemase